MNTLDATLSRGASLASSAGGCATGDASRGGGGGRRSLSGGTNAFTFVDDAPPISRSDGTATGWRRSCSDRAPPDRKLLLLLLLLFLPPACVSSHHSRSCNMRCRSASLCASERASVRESVCVWCEFGAQTRTNRTSTHPSRGELVGNRRRRVVWHHNGLEAIVERAAKRAALVALHAARSVDTRKNRPTTPYAIQTTEAHNVARLRDGRQARLGTYVYMVLFKHFQGKTRQRSTQYLVRGKAIHRQRLFVRLVDQTHVNALL